MQLCPAIDNLEISGSLHKNKTMKNSRAIVQLKWIKVPPK